MGGGSVWRGEAAGWAECPEGRSGRVGGMPNQAPARPRMDAGPGIAPMRSRLAKICRGIDVKQHAGIVHRQQLQLRPVAVQDVAGAGIASQLRQFGEIAGGEPDRMAAPAGIGWGA